MYHDPIIIFSFTTIDLDRSDLKIFFQQKPYFTLQGSELVLHKPTSQPVRELVAGAPPRIFSYSLAFAVNAVRLVVNNVFRQEQSVLDHGENRLTRLRELNQLILDQCIALLDRRFDGL